MLFVIVMDILNNLLSLAETSSLLEPLGGSRIIPHWLSLYVDGVVLFLSLIPLDLHTIHNVIKVFGTSHRGENQPGQEFYRANPLLESTT